MVCLAALVSLQTRAVAAEPVLTITLDQSSVPEDGEVTGTWEIFNVEGLEEAYVHCIYYSKDDQGRESTWPAVYTTKTTSPGKGTFRAKARPGIQGSLLLKANVYTREGDESSPLILESRTPWFDVTAPQGNQPITCVITLDRETVQTNGTITATYVLNGDISGYEVSPQVFGSFGILKPEPGRIVFTPQNSGTASFIIFMRNTDTNESLSFSSQFFTITGEPTYLIGNLTLSAKAAVAGQPLTITWEGLRGVPPYELTNHYVRIFENKKALKEPALTITGENTLSFTPQYGDSGQVYVQIKDATGRTAYLSENFTITGSPAVQPLNCTITLSAQEANPGDTITANWNITGGTPPYTVSSGVNDRMHSTLQPPEPTGSLSFVTHPVPGSYKVSIKVKDALGREGVFYAPPLKMLSRDFDVTLSPSAPKVGETVMVTITPKAGDNTTYYYGLTWVKPDSPNEDDSHSGAGAITATITPYKAGDWLLLVGISDKEFNAAYIATEEIPFTVSGDVAPFSSNIKLDKSSVEVGKPITATWNFAGGEAPYEVDYMVWYIYDAREQGLGVEYEIKPEAKTATLTPLFGTNGYVELYLKDAKGRVLKEKVPFEITGAPPFAELNATVSLDKSKADIGETVTATWNITGGIPPYRAVCEWAIYDTDMNYTLLQQGEKAGSAAIKVSSGTAGQLFIDITDAAGVKATYVSRHFNITGIRLGDADGNREVDLNDVIAIVKYLVNNQDAPASMENANANKDDKVDINDVLWIINNMLVH